MTEYDYSPEAYERYMATQHRIAQWVDQTERHRPEFSTGNNVTPPVPPTVYGDGDDGYFSRGSSGRRVSRSRDYYGTQRQRSPTYAVYPYGTHYGAPVSPTYPYMPNTGGLMVPGPTVVSPAYSTFSQAVPPPPVVIISPAPSHKSHRSGKSHKMGRTRRGGGYYNNMYAYMGHVQGQEGRMYPRLY